LASFKEGPIVSLRFPARHRSGGHESTQNLFNNYDGYSRW